MPPEEPILSQGETDKNLAYLHKSTNMRREIEKASTPLEGIIMPPPRLPPVRPPGLRQKLQFDENPTDSAAETNTDLANIIELPERVNEKNKSLEATELDIDQ